MVSLEAGSLASSIQERIKNQSSCTTKQPIPKPNIGSCCVPTKRSAMKSALLPIRILLLMFLQLAQNARCFLSVTKPFSGRALRQLSTVVSYPSLPSHNYHQLALIHCRAQPTSCRPRTQLFSSATDDSSVVPITVLSGFLGTLQIS